MRSLENQPGKPVTGFVDFSHRLGELPERRPNCFSFENVAGTRDISNPRAATVGGCCHAALPATQPGPSPCGSREAGCPAGAAPSASLTPCAGQVAKYPNEPNSDCCDGSTSKCRDTRHYVYRLTVSSKRCIINVAVIVTCHSPIVPSPDGSPAAPRRRPKPGGAGGECPPPVGAGGTGWRAASGQGGDRPGTSRGHGGPQADGGGADRVDCR